MREEFYEVRRKAIRKARERTTPVIRARTWEDIKVGTLFSDEVYSNQRKSRYELK